MKKGIVLIVDDNKSVLTSLEFLLENEFSKILTASNPNQIAFILSNTSVDVVILDMNFSTGINNGSEGLYWLNHIRKIAPQVQIVMLTAYGDVELAVKALKSGASDFIQKPWDNPMLIQKVKDAFNSQQSKPKKVTTKKDDFEMIIGESPIMMQLIKVVHKVAQTDANILITGENGTGKEMLAREIHRLSPRNRHNMLSVDMGAISESLFESELFGHERGAFTDAYESRIGKFEVANASSLFMDEIGNLSLGLQAKLLTVLQSRNITRVGSNKAIPIDIRLISATNKDIPELIKEEKFREDLFYRINTIHIEIPPLRERGEDLLLFINIFLRRFANKYRRQEMKIHDQTVAKLRTYHWPGNIRELQHAIEKAVILCEGDVIRPKDILVKQTWTPQTPTIVANLEEVEQQAIEIAILQNKGNLTATAEQLGVSRQTLYNKLNRFKL